MYFKAPIVKCSANGSYQENPVQSEAKRPLPRTLLFLITPSEQHLGTKERAPPSPLHIAAAKDAERSPDTSPPWTSHALDGASGTVSFFNLNFKKIQCFILFASTETNLCLKSLFVVQYDLFGCFLGKVCFVGNKKTSKQDHYVMKDQKHTDLKFKSLFL